MEALKATLDCIKHKQSIPKDTAEQLFTEPLPQATFEVLSTIFNLSLPASKLLDDPARHLSVLEQLSLSLGRLTKLPEPCHLLALFRKDLFYEYCRERRQYKCLLNKVYGLFPRANISDGVPLLLEFEARTCEGEEVGNPNWLLTRSVITQWLEAKRQQLTKEVVLCCYILLASPRLLDANDGWTHWDSLWAILYLWLTSQYLEAPLNSVGGRASWCTLEGAKLRAQMMEEGNKASTTQEKALFNLVLFLVEEQLLGESESEYFSEAAKEYLRVPCTTWQHLLTLQLIKQTSAALRHDRLAKQAEDLIVRAIETLDPAACPEFEYLLPHLLPEQQVREYILKRKLEFWNYGLDEDVCEDIAKDYLRDLASFPEENREHIIGHLPLEYFVEEVLGLRGKEKRQGKAVVRTLLRSSGTLATRVHGYLELQEDQCEGELRLFAAQWDAYYSMHLEGVDADNARTCIGFLAFDRSPLSDCFRIKARFPQQSPEIYCEILHKLTDHLLVQEPSPSSCSITDLLLEPNFVEYFQELKEGERDQLWRKWSQLMLRDEAILSQLMAIPAAE